MQLTYTLIAGLVGLLMLAQIGNGTQSTQDVECLVDFQTPITLLNIKPCSAGDSVADVKMPNTATRWWSGILVSTAQAAEPLNVESVGLQTSVAELRNLRKLVDQGVEPLQRDVAELLRIASESWPYGSVATAFGSVKEGSSAYDKRCVKLNNTKVRNILTESGSFIYAKTLAYVFSQEKRFGADARNILLDFTESSGYTTSLTKNSYTGANQCALELSLFVPLYIEAAILLEAYDGWTASDRSRAQDWLAAVAYPITAAIARTRKNNWGTAAAFASWSIAHYLSETQIVLTEFYPKKRTLKPTEAREEHLQSQLSIIGNRWAGDTRCEHFGVQPSGGFPNELRRGDTGCDGLYLLSTDASYDYQIMTVSHLVFHAEALRRHSDNELFAYLLPSEEPMLLTAILFVIDNKYGLSHSWKASDLGPVRIANGFYDDDRLCAELKKSNQLRESRYLPFSRITHPSNCNAP